MADDASSNSDVESDVYGGRLTTMRSLDLVHGASSIQSGRALLVSSVRQLLSGQLVV